MSPVATSYIAPTIAIRPSRTRPSSVWLCSRICSTTRDTLRRATASTNDSFSAAGQVLDGPAGGRIDRLLDVVDDVVEVLAARGLGGRPGLADEVDGRGHSAAPGVPHHQDQLRPGHGAAVLHAGQHLPARDVAGDADAEDVAHAQVEDQLGRRAGVDATEDDGQRVLPLGRGADLAAEVAGQPPAGAEPLVAVLQDLQHLLRGECSSAGRGSSSPRTGSGPSSWYLLRNPTRLTSTPRAGPVCSLKSRIRSSTSGSM